MLSEERRNKVINICRELISHYSVSGQEKGVVSAIKNKMEKMGFDDVQIDRYGNVIGHIKGNKPGKKII